MKPARRRIVLLGMMARMPVAGVVWQTIHYLVGLHRLGCEVCYVEAHGNTPVDFFDHEQDDGWGKAAAFIASVMRRFNLGDQWALDTVYGDRRCYGMSEQALESQYRSADLLINLHGGTVPRPEHRDTGRLVYLETDPVQLQIELYENRQSTVDFLSAHRAFFTFGENYGKPGCKLPVSARFPFHPTRQPVVMDFWQSHANRPGPALTTIGNWRQPCRAVHFQGEVYYWSKHYEFLKFIGLPRRTTQPFELALSSYEPSDKEMLEGRGWAVRHALDFSRDLEPYREYIVRSRGEFTVAKDQNVRLRTGWFSDRSATYLAAGRPVITQETGFSEVLPTGEGLFAFRTEEEVLDAIDRINSDYERHSRAASEIARAYFGYDVVLSSLLERLGI